MEEKVFFNGTKSRGDSWQTMLKDKHFVNVKSPDDIYGKIHTIAGEEVWVYIFDKKTNLQLDTSTWGFLKEDLKWK